MRCNRCGHENNNTARFCARCRQPLAGPAPRAPPASAPVIFAPPEPDRSMSLGTIVFLLVALVAVVLIVAALAN